MDIKSVGHSFANLPARIKDLASDKPDASDDLDSSSPVAASMGGGIEGFITGGGCSGNTPGGLMVGAGGAIGGYLGVKAGEEGSVLPTLGRAVDKGIELVVNAGDDVIHLLKGETDQVSGHKHDIKLLSKLTDKFISQGSFTKAIANGAVSGAVVTGLALAGVSAVLGAPVTIPLLAAGTILGGLSGAAGTLAGSRRATTRDGVYGGYMSGMAAAAFAHNPALSIAGAVAGGIGGKAAKPLGRAILGALSGIVTGALTGVFGGPAGMVAGAVTGGVVGAVGAVIGHPIRNIVRNLSNAIADKAIEKLEPAKRKAGDKTRLAAGIALGALSLAPLGLIFYPLVGSLAVGLGAAAGIGAVSGAIGTYKMLKSQEKGETPVIQDWKANQQKELPPPEQKPADETAKS